MAWKRAAEAGWTGLKKATQKAASGGGETIARAAKKKTAKASGSLMGGKGPVSKPSRKDPGSLIRGAEQAPSPRSGIEDMYDTPSGIDSFGMSRPGAGGATGSVSGNVGKSDFDPSMLRRSAGDPVSGAAAREAVGSAHYKQSRMGDAHGRMQRNLDTRTAASDAAREKAMRSGIDFESVEDMQSYVGKGHGKGHHFAHTRARNDVRRIEGASVSKQKEFFKKQGIEGSSVFDNDLDTLRRTYESQALNNPLIMDHLGGHKVPQYGATGVFALYGANQVFGKTGPQSNQQLYNH